MQTEVSLLQETPSGQAVFLCRRGVAIPKHIPFNASAFTLKYSVTTPSGRKTELLPIYKRGKDFVYVPRHLGETLCGTDVIDRIPKPIERKGITFTGELRPHQQMAADSFFDAAERNSHAGGVIVLPCGFGKTALAIYLGSRMLDRGGVLVVVHKTFLLEQWIESIAKFLPSATVGIIRGDKAEFDRDFIIASIQTLTGTRSKELGDKISKHCILAFFDETHHLAAKTFSKTLEEGIVPCRYRIGLTATPDRKDGLTDLFLAHLGPILYTATRDHDRSKNEQQGQTIGSRESGSVKQISVSSGNIRIAKNRMGKFDYVGTMSNLVAYEPRDLLILNAVSECLEENRHIMVLSERRDHLLRLHRKASERFGADMCGLYMGGMKPADMTLTLENSRVMFVTVSMAAEGLDCPRLDTVIFATPPSASVEQCVGRAQRRIHAHGTLVIDFVDDVFKHRFRERKNTYLRLGFVLKISDSSEIDDADDINDDAELDFI